MGSLRFKHNQDEKNEKIFDPRFTEQEIRSMKFDDEKE